MPPRAPSYVLLLLGLWLGWAGVARARAQVILTDSLTHQVIGHQVSLMKDANHQYPTLAAIWPDSVQRRFMKNQPQVINQGFSTADYWVRFDLTDQSSQTRPWLLEIAFGNYGSLDLYLIQKRTGRIIHKRGGDLLGRQGREIDAPTYLFYLPLEPTESYTVFLRLSSVHGQVLIPLHVWREDGFVRASQLSGLFWGLYYGFVVAVLLYHLAMLLFTRKQPYLLLTLYITAYLLYELTRGFCIGVRYLWPDQPWLIRQSLGFTFMLASISYMVLYNSVLNLRQTAPRLHRVLYGLIGLTVLSWLVSTIDVPGLSRNLVITVTGVLCGGYVIFLGGHSWYQGHRPARYYFFAALMLFLGGFVHSLNRAGVLAGSAFLGQYALNIGSTLEFVFLTLGLADTIRTDRRRQKLLEQLREAEVDAAELRGLTTERERVASEMHDGVGNALLTLRQFVRSQQGTAPMPESASLSKIEQLVQHTYDEVRKIVNNMLPAEFEKKGLGPSLQELIDTLNASGQTQFYLLLPTGEIRLRRSEQFQLYLVLVELVNNILKHAQATEASIRFSLTTDRLLVQIRDNGVGLGSGATTADGRGWANVRQRLGGLNASLQNGNQPEQGTLLTLSVPLNSVSRI